MKLAFDYDDVLVDFVQAWCDSVNEQHPTATITREGLILDGWDMSKHASDIVGMDWLQWLEIHLEYWYNAKTTPGALDALQTLKTRGHTLEIVTNKPEWARPVVWNWLGYNNPPFDQVTITNHFGKEDISNADVLIDDRPSTLDRWVASRPGRVGILFARSQNVKEQGMFPTAYTMQDVVNLVDKISNGKGGHNDPW